LLVHDVCSDYDGKMIGCETLLGLLSLTVFAEVETAGRGSIISLGCN
jgi:hypothetical protein